MIWDMNHDQTIHQRVVKPLNSLLFTNMLVDISWYPRFQARAVRYGFRQLDGHHSELARKEHGHRQGRVSVGTEVMSQR